MLQLIGIPLIVAAWAIPALFALTLAFLFSLAVFRPMYLAWAHVWDTTAQGIRHTAAALAERIAARAYDFAVTHTRSEG